MSEPTEDSQKRILSQRRAKQKGLKSNIFVIDHEDNGNDDDDVYIPIEKVQKCGTKVKSSGAQSSKSIPIKEKETDDEHPNQCTKCSNTYATRGFLSLHMQTHTEGRLICNICFKSFANPRNLKEHLIYMHTEDGQVLYRKKMERKKEYSRNRHRPYLEFRANYAGTRSKFASSVPDSGSSLPCLDCGLLFENQHDLDIHVESRETRIKPVEEVKPKKMFCCTTKGCRSTFSTEEEWEEHFKAHEALDRTKIVCPICGDKYKNKGTMKRHITRVHDEEGRKKAVQHRKKYQELVKAKRRNKYRPSKPISQRPAQNESQNNNDQIKIEKLTEEFWGPIDELVPAKYEKVKVEPEDDDTDFIIGL